MQIIKFSLIPAVFFTGAILVSGQLSDQDLSHFKSEVEIAGVRTDTMRDNDRQRFERLEVNTFQADDDPDNYDMSRFRIRLVVELTDKDKKTYLVQFSGNSPEDRDSEYMGEDYWSLLMAHGELGRLSISAYIVQYGIMDGDTFVPLAEEKDNVEKMLERVRNKTTVLFSGKVYLRHRYIFNESGLGISAESNPVNIRRLIE